MKWMAIETLSMGVGGNLGYVYLAGGFPGSEGLIKDTGTPIALVFVLVGLIAGLCIGFLIYKLWGKKINVKR